MDTDFKEAYYRVQAYDDFFKEELIEDYVEWYVNDGFPKPEGYKYSWYEDDWWKQEHEEFVNEMVVKEIWKVPDYSKVPTREVYDLFMIYKRLESSSARMGFRIEHPDLDAWGQLTQDWKPASQTPTEKQEAALTLEEQIARRLKELAEGGQELPLFTG